MTIATQISLALFAAALAYAWATRPARRAARRQQRRRALRLGLTKRTFPWPRRFRPNGRTRDDRIPSAALRLSGDRLKGTLPALPHSPPPPPHNLRRDLRLALKA